MKKHNLLARVIIIVAVTLLGLYAVIGPRRRPTVADFKWSGIKQTLANNIHLGLDLQGGSHLVMRVKTEEFLKRLTEENFVAAQNAAKDAGFDVKGGRADTGPGNYRVVVEPADASKITEIKEAVEKKVELGDTSVWSYSGSGGEAASEGEGPPQAPDGNHYLGPSPGAVGVGRSRGAGSISTSCRVVVRCASLGGYRPE